jgi:hypothetical protein
VVNGSMQRPVRGLRGRSIVLALAVVSWSATFGLASADPLARVRAAGVSVTAVFSDDTHGYLRVEASSVTLDGAQQVLLDVFSMDNLTETLTCGSAFIPASALKAGRDAIALRVSLASIEWLTQCEDGTGTPTGEIDVTFKADGAYRTTTTQTRHEWLPTYVIHSTGTSEDETAVVRGQLIDAVAPGQSISGLVSRFSSRLISIERR